MLKNIKIYNHKKHNDYIKITYALLVSFFISYIGIITIDQKIIHLPLMLWGLTVVVLGSSLVYLIIKKIKFNRNKILYFIFAFIIGSILIYNFYFKIKNSYCLGQPYFDNGCYLDLLFNIFLIIIYTNAFILKYLKGFSPERNIIISLILSLFLTIIILFILFMILLGILDIVFMAENTAITGAFS